MMRIWKEFSFDASHQLVNLPPEHKCSRLHGHTYRFRLHIGGGIDPTVGWIADWGGLIRAAAEMIINELDHRHLNDINGLEIPTAEILALWIYRRVAKTQLSPLTAQETFDLSQRPHLEAVEVFESLTTGVWYDGA